MALWLKGAIEERGCQGQGCPGCIYQIDEDKESFACVGYKCWNGYADGRELWWLMGKSRRGKRLAELIDETEEDESGSWLMNLNQLQEAVSLLAGLRSELYEFTGNKHFRFNPSEIDWDMEEYSDLISHWKEPDGIEIYTLVNALSSAETAEYYLREALRLGKPVLFDTKD